MGRPATGQTPVRSVRVGPEWDEAAATAKADGESMGDLIGRLLRKHNRARKAAERRKQATPAVAD